MSHPALRSSEFPTAWQVHVPQRHLVLSGFLPSTALGSVLSAVAARRKDRAREMLEAQKQAGGGRSELFTWTCFQKADREESEQSQGS